jgi:hypothetical protein
LFGRPFWKIEGKMQSASAGKIFRILFDGRLALLPTHKVNDAPAKSSQRRSAS